MEVDVECGSKAVRPAPCGIQLQCLSLVRCTKLKQLCLGLQPTQPVAVYPNKQYAFYSHASAAAEASAQAWEAVEVPVLTQLRTLRLGLSGVQVLAVALPTLASLELNGCVHLRQLELRCPLLLSLHVQAATALPQPVLAAALRGVPSLSMLDVQHVPSLRTPPMAAAAAAVAAALGYGGSSATPGSETGTRSVVVAQREGKRSSQGGAPSHAAGSSGSGAAARSPIGIGSTGASALDQPKGIRASPAAGAAAADKGSSHPTSAQAIAAMRDRMERETLVRGLLHLPPSGGPNLLCCASACNMCARKG